MGHGALVVLLALSACAVETEPPAPDLEDEVVTTRPVPEPQTVAPRAPEDTVGLEAVPPAPDLEDTLARLVEQASEPGARGLSALVADARDVARRSPDSTRADSLLAGALEAAQRGDRAAVALAAAQAHGALEADSVRSAALVVLARASAPAPDWAALRRDAAALDRALAGRAGPLAVAARGAVAGSELEDAFAVRLAAEVVIAALDAPPSRARRGLPTTSSTRR